MNPGLTAAAAADAAFKKRYLTAQKKIQGFFFFSLLFTGVKSVQLSILADSFFQPIDVGSIGLETRSNSHDVHTTKEYFGNGLECYT